MTSIFRSASTFVLLAAILLPSPGHGTDDGPLDAASIRRLVVDHFAADMEPVLDDPYGRLRVLTSPFHNEGDLIRDAVRESRWTWELDSLLEDRAELRAAWKAEEERWGRLFVERFPELAEGCLARTLPGAPEKPPTSEWLAKPPALDESPEIRCRVRWLRRLGATEEALELALRFRDADPTTADHHAPLVGLLRSSDSNEWLAALHFRAESVPDHWEARRALVEAFAHLGREPERREAFATAWETAPDPEDLHRLCQTGAPRDGATTWKRACYRDVLAVAGPDSEIGRRVRLDLELGSIAQRVQEAEERGTEEPPDPASDHRTWAEKEVDRGLDELEDGRPGAAARIARAVLASREPLTPHDSAEAHYLLGRAFQAEGDPKAAAQHLEVYFLGLFRFTPAHHHEGSDLPLRRLLAEVGPEALHAYHARSLEAMEHFYEHLWEPGNSGPPEEKRGYPLPLWMRCGELACALSLDAEFQDREMLQRFRRKFWS